jgi:hypothetical protein
MLPTLQAIQGRGTHLALRCPSIERVQESRISSAVPMFRIIKKVNNEGVTFSLSGHMNLAHAKELEAAFDQETLSISLDIREIRWIDRDVVPILACWSSEGIEFLNCPAYLSHWLEDLRHQSDP